jgi:Domain of unknown function (DUF4365)
VTLTLQQHQGLHGEGFVFAMASSAGLLVSRPTLDVDGVDWLISHSGPLGSVRSPKIEVQVKTWSAPTGNDEALAYRMTVPHFNAIAGPGFAVPRYLLLVTVPTDSNEYAVCDVAHMRLGHAAYWLSLADRALLPSGPGDAGSTVVSVPRRNLLTPETLTALVAGNGKEAPA